MEVRLAPAGALVGADWKRVGERMMESLRSVLLLRFPFGGGRESHLVLCVP